MKELCIRDKKGNRHRLGRMVLAIVMAVLMVISTTDFSGVIKVSAASTGILTQDADGYYMIASAEDLQMFANMVNSGSTNINGKLTSDIDLSGISNWTPIGLHSDQEGNVNYDYTGTFDGQGYIISNLNVLYSGSDDIYELGLFSRVSGKGTIRNLGVINASVQSIHDMRVGVITGHFEGNVIENCYTVGAIELSQPTLYSDIGDFTNQYGGITGCCAYATIKNCFTIYDKIGQMNAGGRIDNCYYGTDVSTKASAGELAFLLNGSIQGGYVWYQNIDNSESKDNYPVLDSTHGAVYYKEESSSYTNEIVKVEPKIALVDSIIENNASPVVSITLNGRAYTDGVTYSYADREEAATDSSTVTDWIVLSSIDSFASLDAGYYWLKVSVADSVTAIETNQIFAITKGIPGVEVTIGSNTTQFATMKAALTAVKEDGNNESTMTLLKDVKIDSKDEAVCVINEGKTLNIDFAGHRWQIDSSNYPQNYGTLNMKDSGDGSGGITGHLYNCGTANITSGTYQSQDNKYALYTSGPTTITGGTFSNASGNEAIYVAYNAHFLMTGGTIAQGKLVVSNDLKNNCSGSVQLAGGSYAYITIEKNYYQPDYTHLSDLLACGCYYLQESNRIENSESLLSLTNAKVEAPPVIIMNQPSCESQMDVEEYFGTSLTVTAVKGDESAEGDITFQWYVKKGDADASAIEGATKSTYQLPEGLEQTAYQYYCRLTLGDYSTTTNTVNVTITTLDKVAAVMTADGTTKQYSTLQKAFNAAASGSTIKILSHIYCKYPATFPSGNITFDLNGYTCESDHYTLFDMSNAGIATFQDTSSSGSGILMAYYSKLFVNAKSIVIKSGTYTSYGDLICTNLDIQGGTFTGSGCGNPWIQAENLTISGGNFSKVSYYYISDVMGDNVTVSGGIFNKLSQTGTVKTIGGTLAKGYAFRSTTDKTWITDTTALSNASIENVSVEQAPVSINSQTETTEATYGYSEGDAPVLSVAAVKNATASEAAGITYQWYSIGTGTDGADEVIPGAEGTSCKVPTGLDAGTYSYYCEVTCDGYTVNSETVIVTVEKATPTLEIVEADTSGKVYGDTVKLEVKLSGINSESLTGTLTLKEGSNVLETTSLYDGTGHFSWMSVPAGDHSLTVEYTAATDGTCINYTNTESSAINFNVAKADITGVTVAGNIGVYSGPEIGIKIYTISGKIPEGVKTYYQWKLKDGSWSNGGTYWNPAWEGLLSLNNVGSITARVKLSGDNYNDYISDEVTSILSPKNISDSNIAIDEKGVITDKYYTGSAIEQDAVLITYKDSNGYNLFDLSPETGYEISYENNVSVGEASLIINGEGNYTGTVTKKFNIKYYDGVVTAAYNGSTTKSEWYTTDVAITADGYTISDTLDGTYAAAYLITDEGAVSKTLYFKQNGTGYITDGKEITVKIDKTAPSFDGENDGITICENNWNTFFNTVTFGYFFKETKNVNILATDNVAGIDKYYYYINNSGSTTLKTADDLNKIAFTEGDSFSITDQNKYVIYAYVVDHAGNRSAYICTDGMVIDKTAPSVVVTAPVVSDIYDVSATAKVQMNETGKITYIIKNTEQSGITAQDILDSTEKNTLSVVDGKIKTNLDVPFLGLTANTTYYIYAVGTDIAGNNGNMSSVSFTTIKTQPVFDSNPAITGTYGQQVKDMALSQVASVNGVAGKWSVSSTDKPSVGTSATYDVVFIPDNEIQYETVTVHVTPTVNPKSLTADDVTIGEVTGKYTYDGTEIEPTVTITDNTATIITSDYEYSYSKNINAGTATLTITGKENYTGSVNRNFKIDKAALPHITYPTAYDITYGQQLSASTLTGGSTQYGSFAWTNGNTVPTVTNSGYEVTFTPNDNTVANYEYISNITDTVAINVSKADSAVEVRTVILDDDDKRQAVLTATVTGVANGEIPTGTVKFVDWTTGDDVDLDKIPDVTITDGKAVYTWSGLDEQIYKVEAVYSGSGNYNAATSTELSFDTSKQDQATFIIGNIGAKTYGDEAFTLFTTGGSGNGAVSFTSSDADIVSISGTTATIHKAGTVTITATKAKTDIYYEANETVSLTVSKKALNVNADNKLNIIKGNGMPELTFAVSGLVGNDTFIDPTISTTAVDTGTVGEYDILISGGTLANADSYDVTYTKGRLTIVKAVNDVNVANEIGGGSNSEVPTVIITADKPYLAGEEGKSGWEAILTEITATSEVTSQEPAKINVKMNGTTKIPANVVTAIRGKNVNLVLDMGNGITWTINGMDVSDEQLYDIDLGVTRNSSVIPEDVVDGNRGDNNSVQIELAHNGAFGFKAALTIAFDEDDAGKYANLFYYNEKTGKLEYMESKQIGEDGKASLTFVHASAYTIVISNEAINESMEKPTTDTTNQTQDSIETVTTEVQATDETSGNKMVIWILIGIVVVAVIGGTTIYMWRKTGGKKED